MAGILDFLNGTFLDPRSEEEKENARIGQSYSQGEGAQFYPPENYLDSYQTFSNVDTTPVMATQPVMDKQVVQQPVPQQMSALNNNQGSVVDVNIPQDKTPPPVEEPSFMDKASDFFNEERMARMTIALNSMRLNPDPNIAKSMELKLDRLQKEKTNNKTLEYLKGKYPELAKLVESGVPLKDAIAMMKDTDKDFSELRKQFLGLPTTKSFASQATAYGRVMDSASDPSPAGDMALVFNYMKILDPGSTVREGEFATAKNAGGVDDKVKSLYNSIIQGTILSENQRKDFVNRAGKLYKGAEALYNKTSSYYEGLSGKTREEFAPDLRYTTNNTDETLQERAQRLLEQKGIK